MNFEFARENMIKQQVLTEGVPVSSVVEVMMTLPREKFLPKEYQSLAYCDTGFTLNGRELRSPTQTARLIDALSIKPNENILKLGLECGYATAILAKVSNSVEVLDYSDDKLELTKRQLSNMGIYNVEFNTSEHLTNIINNDKRYDCIYVSNVVNENEIDESLLSLLDTGGRIVFVIRTSVCDKSYLITKIGAKEYQREFLFDMYNK